MTKKRGVGILGYGSMGRTHSFAYKVLPLFDPKLPETKLVAVFGRTEANVGRFASEYGFETYYTDWKKVVNNDKVEIINVCTPPSEHSEAAVEALEKGRNVICEKPLAANLEEAERMVRAAERGRGLSMTMFSVRFLPAIQRAKKLINEGFLGNIYRVFSFYPRMSLIYPKRYFTWKDKLKPSGGGALLDLGVHITDLIRFLVGEVEEVFAATGLYLKERPVKGTEKVETVETEDTGLVMMKLARGLLGFMEASKVALGSEDAMRIDINGSKGAMSWRLDDPSVLRLFSIEDSEMGWKRVRVDNTYPFIDGVSQGHLAGIHHFLNCLEKEEMPEPSFEDGLKSQEIIDAAYRSSREGKWVSLSR